jgi:hypothetical protein
MTPIFLLTGISLACIIGGLILIGRTENRRGGALIYLGVAITVVIGFAIISH